MGRRGHAYFGLTIVALIGSTYLGASRDRPDGRAAELRQLLAREAEIKADLIAAGDEAHHALLRWEAAGGVGRPPCDVPPADVTAELGLVQMRIHELSSPGR